MLATSDRRIAAAPTRRLLTVEHLAYLGLAAVSVFLHFWALDGRALHHDETIHAFYSWTLYQGQGYIHDPLTHGPFLYYWTALQYFLFGDNEWTARLAAATFGIALTLLPWFLRSTLGRGTALMIAFYLTISPVALYVGRFIRHDIFAVTFELLCLIGILRYVATRRVRWLYIFAGSLGLMFTTIETSYLFTLTLVSFIVLVTLWQVDRRLLAVLGIYVVLAGGALKLLPANRGLLVTQAPDGQYTAALDAQGKEQWLPLPLVTEQQALIVRNQGGDNLLISETNGQEGYLSKLKKTLFGESPTLPDGTPAALPIHTVNNQTLQGNNGVFLHPNITGLTILSAVFLALMIALLWLIRDKQRLTIWRKAVNRSGERSLLPALDSLWSIHGALALGLFFVVYALFFTSFGTHSSGVVSGITGSLLYWVAQHDVQRGGQPQHYYLVQLLVYEPLLLTLGIGSMIAGVINLGIQIKRGAALTARAMAPGLLAWWAGGSLALYTWAGEKMPWITLHVAVPLVFSCGWGLATLLRWAFKPLVSQAGLIKSDKPAPARRAEWQGLAWYLGAMGMLALFATAQLARMVRATAEQPDGAGGTPTFILVMMMLGLAITGGYALWHGPRRATGGLLAAVALMFSLYSFRSAWRLNYQNGDIPVEMMVYVQSSPDVKTVMDRLGEISVAETGRMDLPVMFDNEQIWKWYSRNFVKHTEFSGAMSGPAAEDVQAILMIDSNWGANEANVQGFVEGRFPLRWWFPEHEFYRLATQPKLDETGMTIKDADGKDVTEPAPFEQDSTIGRFVRKPMDAPTVNELWRYLLFRQPPGQLSSVDFKIYVRPRYAYVLGLPQPNAPAQSQVR